MVIKQLLRTALLGTALMVERSNGFLQMQPNLVQQQQAQAHQQQHHQRSNEIGSNTLGAGRKQKSLDIHTKARLVLPILSSSSAPAASSEDDSKKGPGEKKRASWPITLWVHLASIWVILNYRSASCWPKAMVNLSLPTWNFVHSLSGMLFSGSIITTTVLEWIVVNYSRRSQTQSNKAVYRFWFQNAPEIEQWLVLPALTGSIISGVAQAAISYGCFKLAPRHVKSTLHVLFLFGLWWGFTDRKTQSKAQEVDIVQDDKTLPPVLRQRRISNVVSCVFLVAIYAIMVLKPGYEKPS